MASNEMPDMFVGTIGNSPRTSAEGGYYAQQGAPFTVEVKGKNYTCKRMAWHPSSGDSNYFFNTALVSNPDGSLVFKARKLTRADITKFGSDPYSTAIPWDVAKLLENSKTKPKTAGGYLEFKVTDWNDKKKAAVVSFVDAMQLIAPEFVIGATLEDLSTTKLAARSEALSFNDDKEGGLPGVVSGFIISDTMRKLVDDFTFKVFGIKEDKDDYDSYLGWWRACISWTGYMPNVYDYVLATLYIAAKEYVSQTLLVTTSADGTQSGVVKVGDTTSTTAENVSEGDIPGDILISAMRQGPDVTVSGVKVWPSPVIITPDGGEQQVKGKKHPMPAELNYHSHDEMLRWYAVKQGILWKDGKTQFAVDVPSCESFDAQVTYQAFAAVAGEKPYFMPVDQDTGKSAYGDLCLTDQDFTQALFTKEPMEFNNMLGDYEGYLVNGEPITSTKAAYNQEGKHMMVTLENGRNQDPGNTNPSVLSWSIDCKWWWWLIAIVVIFCAYKLLGATDSSRAARVEGTTQRRLQKQEQKESARLAKQKQKEDAKKEQQQARKTADTRAEQRQTSVEGSSSRTEAGQSPEGLSELKEI